MIVALLAVLGATTAPGKDHSEADWIYDGERSCVFNENIGKPRQDVRCSQYHRETKRQKGKITWSEWRYMWKKGTSFEVRYAASEGSVGMSDFTIGQIYDKRGKFSGHKTSRAVSYSPGKGELIIGVPNEGYRFSMKGGI